MNYFKLGSIQVKLKKLDEWLRNRLRYCIWHHWKKPDRKRKNLIRLGISNGQAYAWSRTRMGGWAVAQSPIGHYHYGKTTKNEGLYKFGRILQNCIITEPLSTIPVRLVV